MRTRHGPCLALILALLALCRCGKESQQLFSTEVAVLSISGGLNYDFGLVEVGQVKEAIFTVTNTGQSGATQMQSAFNISAFRYWGGAYPGETGDCGEELDPGESCLIHVAFAPTHALPYSSPIQIVYHNGIEHKLTGRPILHGTGMGTP